MRLNLICISVGILLISSHISPSDGSRNKKRKGRRGRKNIEADSIEYASETEKLIKLAELKNMVLMGGRSDQDGVTMKTILATQEIDLRKDLIRAMSEYSDKSAETASALHLLGRNMFEQQKYDEVVEISAQIVRIHEEIDGPESLNTALALGNVGSVSFRLGRFEDCRVAMNRALHIMIMEYGDDSKEVLLHRAKMLTFKIEDGRDGNGMTDEEYRSDL